MATTATDTRKEQIYRAASALFMERGYRATSVRDIARELDLQGGSLYAHITSKEDVLWEIVARAASAFFAAVRPIAEQELPAPEKLRRMIHAHVSVVVGELARAAVFFQDWRHLSESRKREVLALRDGYEALFRRVIAEGVVAGEFASCDPKLTSIFVLSALNGIPGWFRPEGELAADEVAERLAELVLNGMREDRDPHPASRIPHPASRIPNGRTERMTSIAATVLEKVERADELRRREEFFAHVEGGGKVEATDWMPDEYRQAVLKFVEMHANSELMGVLPERDWILRAPTLKRKLALTSKIQDEVGHAQILYRVAEDLGKPRAQMLDDLINGRTKFHNVFHYPTKSWADVGIIAWLVDAAAIVAQQALRESSYAPYARAMKRICAEESVHIIHGRDVVLTMMAGTAAQQAMVQEALDRWWGPLMQMHGPPSDPVKDKDLRWKIKSKHNDQLRQEFLNTYVPRIWEIGLTLPDPALRYDEAAERWVYTEPDWNELRHVVTGHGPASEARLGFRRLTYEETAWVREVVMSDGRVAA